MAIALLMTPGPGTFATALYVRIDDSLTVLRGPGRIRVAGQAQLVLWISRCDGRRGLRRTSHGSYAEILHSRSMRTGGGAVRELINAGSGRKLRLHSRAGHMYLNGRSRYECGLVSPLLVG
jgi:hypothetical protein